MSNFIEKYLFSQNIAYLVFDSNLKLIRFSGEFNNLLPQKDLKIGDDFFYLFPEFFGLEKILDDIKSKKRSSFFLEKINKLNSKNEIIYYDFTLSLCDNNSDLVLFVNDSTEKSSLEQKIKQQQNEINILKESISYYKNNSLDNLWGNSAEIKSIRKFIKKIAGIKKTSILLTGESGTGKTLIAKAIHNLSGEKNKPFVEINCASIPENLIESEIFGHVKGAFTNAVSDKIGLIEEADGGTLFLDEIGELPINLQSKLLSFLETKRFRQVGSSKEKQVNVRIITATNKDLKKAIKEKEFREDLYYRINVVSLEIPSLRERGEDIIIIAENFVKMFADEFNRTIPALSKGAKQKLLKYYWPGNIRELKNVIERVMIFCDKTEINAEDIIILTDEIQNVNKIKPLIPASGVSLDNIEKQYLEKALKITNGNQTKAAKLLDLSLDTFRYRIKKFNLSV